jgi:hypothetical protein
MIDPGVGQSSDDLRRGDQEPSQEMLGAYRMGPIDRPGGLEGLGQRQTEVGSCGWSGLIRWLSGRGGQLVGPGIQTELSVEVRRFRGEGGRGGLVEGVGTASQPFSRDRLRLIEKGGEEVKRFDRGRVASQGASGCAVE